MGTCVVACSDLYRPTVNGVTYTIELWRDRWTRGYGRMPVVFPRDDEYEPGTDEFPVRGVRAPLYSQYHLAFPVLPRGIPDPDVVHAHTPFTLGIAGRRLARRADVPLVASYHTLVTERLDHGDVSDDLARRLRRVSRRYERWFFDRATVVIAPSDFARRHLVETVGVDVDVEVVSNGVDTDRFRPVDPTTFLRNHDVERSGPLLGYTGRHSFEKRLEEAIDTVDGTDATLLLAGDGPERPSLEARAASVDADVRYLGFLDRDDLPAFYSALDAFVLPSPTETQGLVAMEAIACGTPVVAADAAALSDTVTEGETGAHYHPGDVDSFRDAITRVLADRDRLVSRCLRERSALSVDHSVDRLAEIYDRIA